MLKGIFNLAAIFYILIVVLPTVLVALRAISGFRKPICMQSTVLNSDLVYQEYFLKLVKVVVCLLLSTQSKG
jgi:hypothetical protein